MKLETQLDPAGAEFAADRAAMTEKLEAFRAIERLVLEKSREKPPKGDKLLPRDRLNLLLDPGSPWVELSSLAGYLQHDDRDGSLAGGGLIAGIGFVEGTRVLAVANNYTIKGGTISPAGLRKILRLHEIALRQKLPLVTLAESGGANLNYAAEVYVEGARAFANQARLSAAGIPQVTVVHGNATAGGAYQPGLSDYLVLVEGQSKMFLAGPPLVKAATGQVADDESLGGARLHAETTGTGEFLAPNDVEAIGQARRIIRGLGWNDAVPAPARRGFAPPLYPEDELLGLVPSNPKKPFDAREIVARLADGSEWEELKADYEPHTLCGRAQVFGRACGFIGNNGPITARGAGKAAQFIELCEQSGTPLVFLHNTTGFMVGTDAEQSGIIRQGAKMIQAVANATVPRISILVAGSFGAGNYAMCGRGFGPDFLFSWPNARTAVMGGEQAGKVLRIVAEEKLRKAGQAPTPEQEKELAALEQKTAAQLERTSSALFATSQLWDDGLIDPRDTRKLLGFLLDTCLEARLRPLRANRFGVPRH